LLQQNIAKSYFLVFHKGNALSCQGSAIVDFVVHFLYFYSLIERAILAMKPTILTRTFCSTKLYGFKQEMGRDNHVSEA